MSHGLTYFDCNMTIGPRWNMQPGERYSLGHVLECMDRCGVDAALVSSGYGPNYDPLWANQRLLEETDAHARLFPLWSAVPAHCGDFPEPDVWVKDARRAGVRAVRLYPNQHAFSLDRDVIGPLMDALAKANMLVVIDRGELAPRQDLRCGGYERLQAFGRAFPRNRILLLKSHWSDLRLLFPVMDACPNLHVDMSDLQFNLAPEVLVQRYGADRILFGSGGPAMSPGAARALVDWAELPVAQRRKIASGNLRRLLGVRQLPVVDKRPADDLVATVWQGKPLEQIEVLDAHAHVNHEGAGGVGTHVQPGGDASGMRRLFRRIGIQKTAASAWLGIMSPDAPAGNDVTYAAMQAEPDFMLGYATMDPAQMSADEILDEIRLRYEEQGFVGLKPYIRTSAKFDDPGYAPWYRYGAKRRLFGLFHDQHTVAAELADTFKGLQVLLAHSGASISVARRNGNLAAEHANVYCEITLTPVTNGAIELMVELAGPDRVLFGTDAPMRDPRPQLGWAVHADLSRQDKVKLLGGNFARILAGIRPPRRKKTS